MTPEMVRVKTLVQRLSIGGYPGVEIPTIFTKGQEFELPREVAERFPLTVEILGPVAPPEPEPVLLNEEHIGTLVGPGGEPVEVPPGNPGDEPEPLTEETTPKRGKKA